MHRDDLLEKLNRYQPADASEHADLDRVLQFVCEHPTCFESHHPPGHFTGSAWLLDSTGKRVLLTLHGKLGKWLQLGGHADGDGDLLAVALRESREESGIDAIEPISEEIFDLGVHETPGHDGMAEHLHFDIRFLLRCRESDRFVVSDESHALSWFTPDQVDAMDADESVLRMNKKWKLIAQSPNWFT